MRVAPPREHRCLGGRPLTWAPLRDRSLTNTAQAPLASAPCVSRGDLAARSEQASEPARRACAHRRAVAGPRESRWARFQPLRARAARLAHVLLRAEAPARRGAPRPLTHLLLRACAAGRRGAACPLARVHVTAAPPLRGKGRQRCAAAAAADARAALARAGGEIFYEVEEILAPIMLTKIIPIPAVRPVVDIEAAVSAPVCVPLSGV